MEPIRIYFHGGPADGQYRVFPRPPSSINWMTADGPFVYVLVDNDGVKSYEPKGG